MPVGKRIISVPQAGFNEQLHFFILFYFLFLLNRAMNIYIYMDVCLCKFRGKF